MPDAFLMCAASASKRVLAEPFWKAPRSPERGIRYLFQRDTFGMMFRELTDWYAPETTESAPDLTETLPDSPPWQRTQECVTMLSFDPAPIWERRTSKEALHLTRSITYSVWGSIPQPPDSSWGELSLCHKSFASSHLAALYTTNYTCWQDLLHPTLKIVPKNDTQHPLFKSFRNLHSVLYILFTCTYICVYIYICIYI